MSAESGVDSITSYTTTFVAPVGTESRSANLVFSIGNGTVKKFLKTVRKKKEAQQNYFIGEK